MHKLLMMICPFLLVCGANAQTMQVWMKDGTRQDYAVSSIESITFSELTDMDLARQEIEQFLDDWNAAMIAADTARLGAMMDDSIILRHITGMTQTKREWLEEVASGSMKYHKIVKRDVSISFASDGSASVSFTSVITATIWGSYGTWTLSGSMRLVKRNGRWIRVE
ncbi:MAG: nuclear transport factor 2 family protein [Prevotella sp.]|nr:nuclear transport factor 2 family protein [Prevotella sp.]